MTSHRSLALLACMLGAALVTGCANKPLAGAAAPSAGHARTDGAAPAAASTPSSSGLKEGIALYNNGDYNGAIRRLGLADVTGAPKVTQLEALKYMAFSYCVTSR